MKKERLAEKLFFVGGVVELVVGTVHFLMPLSIDRSAKLAGVTMEYRSFISLASIAIGVCLVTLGFLSIYISRCISQDARTGWLFCLSQGLLWTARLILELALPVRIPLFFLPNPTTFILPMLIVLALLFLVPTLVVPKELLKKSIQETS